MSRPAPEDLEPLVLSPCPFCGLADVQIFSEPIERKRWVFCRRCHASGPTGDTVEECAIAWNKRPRVA